MKNVLLIAVLFISSITFASEFYPEKYAERVVKIALKEKDIKCIRTIALEAETLKEGRIVLYEFCREEGNNFYVAIAEAKGRYEYFDYLMEVDLDFVVKKIRILKYRSEYGGEIKSKKWLTQFESYSTGELRYKKEISALSGATLSAKGLVADVPGVLAILKESVSTTKLSTKCRI